MGGPVVPEKGPGVAAEWKCTKCPEHGYGLLDEDVRPSAQRHANRAHHIALVTLTEVHTIWPGGKPHPPCRDDRPCSLYPDCGVYPDCEFGEAR